MRKALILLILGGLILSSPGLALASEASSLTDLDQQTVNNQVNVDDQVASQSDFTMAAEADPVEGLDEPYRDDGEEPYIDKNPAEQKAKTLNAEADIFSGRQRQLRGDFQCRL